MRNENHNWNKHQCQSHCHNFRFSEFKLPRFDCLCFYSSDSLCEFKLPRFNCLCFYYLDSLCEFKLPRFNCLCFYSSDSLNKFKLPRFNSLGNLCSHWPHYYLFFYRTLISVDLHAKYLWTFLRTLCRSKAHCCICCLYMQALNITYLNNNFQHTLLVNYIFICIHVYIKDNKKIPDNLFIYRNWHNLVRLYISFVIFY